MTLSACSSSKEEYKPPTRVNQGTPAWDYETIQKSREAEAAESAKAPPPAGDDANCVVMTKSEMIRAKAQGCKPLDERQGNGAGKFCCPRD